MKQRRGPFEVIKKGSVQVKLYRVEGPSSTYYQIADYSEGSRRLRTFTDLAEAREAANKISRLMARGETSAASIRNRDAASFGRALELLRPTGDSIELAASRYAEAVRQLGSGDRLNEAVKYFIENDPGNLPDKTVRETADEFLAQRKARGKSVRYLGDLESRLNRFCESFKVNLVSVRGSEVQAWLDGLKAAPQTLKNYRTVLGTFFAFAKTRGYVRINPVESTEAIRQKSEGAVEIYTVGELSLLLKAASPAFVPCIALGAFAGLRSAELQRLDWRDVDFEGGYVTVGAGKAKTRSRRLVPIGSALRSWLEPYANKHGRIWADTHDHFYDAQSATAEASGLKWKPNGLRHSYASYRLAQIQNANQVALELGNSPGVVFKHYRELVKKVDAHKWFGILPGRAHNVVPMMRADADS